MPHALDAKEIILAGGAGGLGSATTRLLAAEGAKVIASYKRNHERASALCDVARIFHADLADATDRARLLDTAPNMYGLVVFVGDPARISHPSQFEECMRFAFEVNTLGPVLLAREAAERMRRAGTPGSIVLFSTMQSIGLFPGSTAYATSKTAVLQAARILAKECCGPSNIRVNVVAPGVTAAGMAEASIASGKYERYLNEGVIPRYGRAEDIARAVRFFLEPDNYITGQVLTVDGGLTL